MKTLKTIPALLTLIATFGTVGTACVTVNDGDHTQSTATAAQPTHFVWTMHMHAGCNGNVTDAKRSLCVASSKQDVLEPGDQAAYALAAEWKTMCLSVQGKVFTHDPLDIGTPCEVWSADKTSFYEAPYFCDAEVEPAFDVCGE